MNRMARRRDDQGRMVRDMDDGQVDMQLHLLDFQIKTLEDERLSLGGGVESGVAEQAVEARPKRRSLARAALNRLFGRTDT